MPYLPRARYVVYRGMWAELPENKLNEAPRNERVYESDLLTITTDVRMAKVPEIFASSPGHGGVEQSQGIGGGGPVEAVFWVKGAMTQWRIKGEAYVVGQDIEGEGDESSGTRTVKSKVGERMRVVKQEGKEDWSWAKELTAHFGNLSPGMRGSFKVGHLCLTAGPAVFSASQMSVLTRVRIRFLVAPSRFRQPINHWV